MFVKDLILDQKVLVLILILFLVLVLVLNDNTIN